MLAVYAIFSPFVAVETPPLKTEVLARAPSTVSVLDGRDPAYTYRLTNPGKVAYVVSRIEGSCGCLATTLSSDGDKATLPLILPVTLSPGQSLTVRATVRLSELRPGRFHKTVTVWGRVSGATQPENMTDAIALSQAEPLARVEMEGTLAQPVLFAREAATQPVPLSGAPIALGQVASSGRNPNTAGALGEFTLLVTPDPRLFTSGDTGGAPRLASSHSAVTVTPLSDSVPARKGDLRTLRYRVQIPPDAPLGPFLATLSFRPTESAKQGGDGVCRELAWRTASLLVTGEIVGDLFASPSLVTFVLGIPKVAESTGVINGVATAPDRNLTRQIVLTAIGPDVFVGLTVRADDALVRATLSPATATTGPDADRRVLTVTLSPDAFQVPFVRASFAAPNAPAFGGAGGTENTLHTRVTLTLTNGQQIVIPVSVYRTNPAKPPASESGSRGPSGT